MKQILLYSGLAMAGILISGSFVLGFVNGQKWIMWVFAGLAVLTVPHMLVMHAMYHWGRINEKPLIRNNLPVAS